MPADTDTWAAARSTTTRPRRCRSAECPNGSSVSGATQGATSSSTSASGTTSRSLTPSRRCRAAPSERSLMTPCSARATPAKGTSPASRPTVHTTSTDWRGNTSRHPWRRSSPRTTWHAGEMDRFAPCTTSGVTASHEQVCRVLALHGRPPVIALDGDQAGVEGTGRWLSGLCLDGGRPALKTTLPAGTDPAEWLVVQGDSGLTAFDRRGCLRADEHGIRPSLPGRELVRLLAERHPQPVRAVLTSLAPLATQLPPEPATRLLRGVEQEMTRLGWNPNGFFTRAMAEAVARVRPSPEPQTTAGTYPHTYLSEPGIHRSATPDSPLSLIHISEPTRRTPISYAVFCLKKKK